MAPSVLDVTVVKSAPLGEIEAVWRRLEQHAESSFFVSWIWIGAWMRAVRPDASLLVAANEGTIVGAALIVRAPRNWRNPFRAQYRLHETGMPLTDGLFVEYNGVLADRAELTVLLPAMLAALKATSNSIGAVAPELVVSRASPDFAATLLALYPRAIVIRRDRCPFVNLARLRREGGSFLGALSANTRQQLRRARRLFEAFGELQIERAETTVRAHEFLAALKPLHNARWSAKGKLSGFDNPVFEPMLNELIAEGVSSGAVDVLHIAAGDTTLGYLVNFNYRGTVTNYTSGFQYSVDGRLKPGLVSHLMAIERAYAQDALAYNFLAGGGRYKDNLSTDSEEICGIRLRL